MNQAEIMTLIKSKVKPEQISIAIMAGKLQGVLRTAHTQVARAEEFGQDADWTELLRVMQGTLGETTDHRAEESDHGSRKSRLR